MIGITSSKVLLSSMLSYMSSLGLSGPDASVATDGITGDYLALLYTSEIRGVMVSFFPAVADRPARVTVFIDDRRGRSFSLRDWLKERQPHSVVPFDAERFSNHEEFLKDFAAMMRPVLEGPLRATIRGAEWDAVSFDWQGYR